MVNYCLVYGCGRNNQTSKHLTFFSLPKERERLEQWLIAAGRQDLLNKSQEKHRLSQRMCSRHFSKSSLINKHLCADAVPSLCLPGSWSEDEEPEDPLPHEDIVCNQCTEQIVGFRYKCVICDDFDLCQKCELNEAHPQHYMLRIPKSTQFKVVEKIINDWHKSFKALLPDKESKSSLLKENKNHKQSKSLVKKNKVINYDEDMDALADSDDEPITKYVKRDDGLDLDEAVKHKIRNEILRVLNLTKPDDDKRKPKKKSPKKRNADEKIDTSAKKVKKEKKNEESVDVATSTEEVHFADVNQGLYIIDATNINTLPQLDF